MVSSVKLTEHEYRTLRIEALMSSIPLRRRIHVI
jgi:hypothetical protein